MPDYKILQILRGAANKKPTLPDGAIYLEKDTNTLVIQNDNNEIKLNKPKVIEYDHIIRTQAEFEALIASPTWLDAISVCFVGDGGSLKFTRSDGLGCKIPPNVKQIKGLNSASIEVSNLRYEAAQNPAALFYAQKPTSNEYQISSLSVTCVQEDGLKKVAAFLNCHQLIDCTGISNQGTGFVQCVKLINCTGIGYYSFNSCNELSGCEGTSSYGSAFSRCVQLTNCYGSGKNPFENCENLLFCVGTSNERGISFYMCYKLISCIGSSNGFLTFYECGNLTDCKGTNDTSGWIYSSVAYSNCNRLTNCFGEAGSDVEGGSATAFENCTQLANCQGVSFRGRVASNGFLSCHQLVNCTGDASGATAGANHGFGYCNQVTGCRGSGTTSNPNTGTGYGFFDCSYLNGCRAGGEPSTTGFLGGANTKIDTATVVET